MGFSYNKIDCFSLPQKIRFTKQCGEKNVQISVNAIVKLSFYSILLQSFT